MPPAAGPPRRPRQPSPPDATPDYAAPSEIGGNQRQRGRRDHRAASSWTALAVSSHHSLVANPPTTSETRARDEHRHAKLGWLTSAAAGQEQAAER
jgi:hypothetical protein